MPLEREEDWQRFFQGSYVRASSGVYEGRVEPIALPFLFEKPIIRVFAESQGSRRTWWLAGTLTQEIGLGMELQQWRLPLGRKKILQVELAEKYRLRFEPVAWLSNLYIEIDTYEGT
ncbi:MAG: hypothetical protein JGK21_30340 [Microcoleus sp. PH2017_22_RUC_O_B]|uniref:hypothetical protein n=1 Tax=unclassified Microcoleus TaxID=2642155 RepID=UPI001D3B4055|nr:MULTISPECIES: hypothetical protein [unclassified Microcoleus]MCC3532262.1 hypothetical protein [Microcoleus sp. PH2017_21_RUC_O_A]MCC3544549.1 hypothetical protein [Microcoleus sp. PH2017_22_RUC_O_B]